MNRTGELWGLPVHCGCGRSYTTARAWFVLKYVGMQDYPGAEPDTTERMELRNCTCRSTIARVWVIPRRFFG